jgi:YtxH-like protein
MAIIAPILAALSRMAGKLLNTIFGWATVTLFGRVPQSRQIFLSIIALGSVLWLAVVLGIAFPDFGTFLLGFVPLPDWVNEAWVRLAMLVAAVLIPVVVGVISQLMLEPGERPQGILAKGKEVLKGYPYTLGLALTLVLMTILVPFIKLRVIMKRWSSQHMPVLVEADDYLKVVDLIERTLDERAWSTQRQQASWMLRLPTRLLTFFASGAIDDLVAENLTVLRAPSLEVVFHPADLVINGKKEDVVHARAAITEQLSFSEAHLTWTKEGNELEDQLNELWRRIKGTKGKSYWTRAAARLQDIDRELGRLEVPFEEWEVLFRTRLMLERELLRGVVNLNNANEEAVQLTDGDVKHAGARLLEEDATEEKTGIDKGSVMGIITGASVGALAGLLLAPKPGKETRQMVQGQANKYAVEIRRRVEGNGHSRGGE